MGSCCGAGEGWAAQEAGRVRVEGISWPHPTWEAAGPGGGLQIWGAGNSPESDPSPPPPGPRPHQPPKWSPGSALSHSVRRDPSRPSTLSAQGPTAPASPRVRGCRPCTICPRHPSPSCLTARPLLPLPSPTRA